ncbi:MAG TPA: GNAT family N-acetyltransferase [Caulobacteraceae bacterium]|jgi:GNAT superfamily N-acetyltransferase|nr:GNAT family N-acetyltransferase [Caulobacteraceae bacterium]
MAVIIRDFEPPRDRAAALAFILGSQLYERAFEADRRTDAEVADDYYAQMMDEVAKNGGRVFVAEEDGRAIGWAAFAVVTGMVYVIEEERRHGYIAELFVETAARGRGVGRALIGACENEARRRGLGQVRIGLLAANRRAADIYARAGYQPYTAELRKYL